MNPSTISTILLYVFPLLFIGIGLYVLLLQKPVILSYKWTFAVIPLVFIIPVLLDFSHPLSIRTFHPFSLIIPIIFFFYFYFIKRGYMVLGADGDDFQKAFIETLQEENLEYEQTFISIKIKEPALEMSIAFQTWVGSGQIRLKSRKNKQTFDRIISHLKTKTIKPNLIIPILYLLIGIVLILMQIRTR